MTRCIFAIFVVLFVNLWKILTLPQLPTHLLSYRPLLSLYIFISYTINISPLPPPASYWHAHTDAHYDVFNVYWYHSCLLKQLCRITSLCYEISPHNIAVLISHTHTIAWQAPLREAQRITPGLAAIFVVIETDPFSLINRSPRILSGYQYSLRC